MALKGIAFELAKLAAKITDPEKLDRLAMTCDELVTKAVLSNPILRSDTTVKMVQVYTRNQAFKISPVRSIMTHDKFPLDVLIGYTMNRTPLTEIAREALAQRDMLSELLGE